jgi:predicted HicB family RNase H-like nuclease
MKATEEMAVAEKPKPNRKRAHLLQFRVTEEEAGLFAQRAQADGLSVSAWVRMTLKKAAHEGA